MSCEECGEFVADGETVCDDCDKAGCKRECGCDSLREHNAAVERSRLDFLRDPGPAPTYMSPEQASRARAGIAEAQRKAGLPMNAFDYLNDAVERILGLKR